MILYSIYDIYHITNIYIIFIYTLFIYVCIVFINEYITFQLQIIKMPTKLFSFFILLYLRGGFESHSAVFGNAQKLLLAMLCDYMKCQV